MNLELSENSFKLEILGEFEVFRQTFPANPIYYDPPNLGFSKNYSAPDYYYGRESTQACPRMENQQRSGILYQNASDVRRTKIFIYLWAWTNSFILYLYYQSLSENNVKNYS